MGGPGSFHHIAALELHGADASIEYFGTPSQVLDRLSSDKIDRAVLAVANNSAGYVQDLVHHLTSPEGELYWIDAETYLPVQHQLLGLPGVKLSDIRTVHSHRAAFGQCTALLEGSLAETERVEQNDTATAAMIVGQRGDPTQAAIASQVAAEIHGLNIVLPNIQDSESNITRFLGLTKRENGGITTSDDDKTTMILRTRQKPGSLRKALAPFDNAKINIALLQSRIISGSQFNMDFWLEFEAGLAERRTQKVLRRLGAIGCSATLLGSYRKAPIPETVIESTY